MPYIIALGGLVGLVAYLIQEITRTNARPISNKIRSINEFNELDEVALDLLLENALVITTGSKRFELAQFCSHVRNEQPEILAPLQQEGELFIPALLLEAVWGIALLVIPKTAACNSLKCAPPILVLII